MSQWKRCAMVLSVATLLSCKTTRESNALTKDAPAPAAAMKPLFVVIGGYGTCSPFTNAPFAAGGTYVSPINGARWGASWSGYATGNASASHPSGNVSQFNSYLFPYSVRTGIWGENSNFNSEIFACHSDHTARDSQQFVWWSGVNYDRSYASDNTAASRYAKMGMRRFYVKTPDRKAGTLGDANDPYGANIDRFADDVVRAAAALNADAQKRPVYIIGHSMGGYMASRLTLALEGKAVQVAGLMTLDPISPRWCPANNLTNWGIVRSAAVGIATRGLVATVVAPSISSDPSVRDCTRGFPPDLVSSGARIKSIIVAGRRTLGIGSDSYAWIHYYQRQSVTSSGPMPHADVNEKIKVGWGLPDNAIDAGHSHVFVNQTPAVWSWSPRYTGSGRSRRLVGVPWMGYRIRADGIWTTRRANWAAWNTPLYTVGGSGLRLAGEEPAPGGEEAPASDTAPAPGRSASTEGGTGATGDEEKWMFMPSMVEPTLDETDTKVSSDIRDYLSANSCSDAPSAEKGTSELYGWKDDGEPIDASKLTIQGCAASEAGGDGVYALEGEIDGAAISSLYIEKTITPEAVDSPSETEHPALQD